MLKKAGLWTVFFTIPLAAALGERVHILQFGIEDGLPQSQVTTITQDDEGNLWIGTMAGIACYDGRKIIAFTKADSLAEDWVTSCLKDRGGNLWFGHWGGGVSKYDVKTKKFRNLDFDIISNFKTVTVIFEDRNGNLWFGTKGAGIYKYDIATNRAYIISSDEELSGNHVSAICEDNAGNIWIGTENGITIYDPSFQINDENGFSYINIEMGLINNRISALTLVGKEEMWVATETSGIVILNISNPSSQKNIENIKEVQSAHLSISEGLPSNNIRSIALDKRGRILIGTNDKGAVIFTSHAGVNPGMDLKNSSFRTINTTLGLNYNQISAIFADREGNIWIGTSVGLNKYSSERFILYDETEGIANNVVWAVKEDSRGNLWLGTNKGASKITFTGNRTFSVKNYSAADGLSDETVLAIGEDGKRNIWLGTANGGASIIENGDGKIRKIAIAEGLPDKTIYSIASDKEGNLWLATKAGAVYYNTVSGEMKTYTSADGLSGNHVYRVFADSKGRLWCGLLGGFLSMYDGAKWVIFGEKQEMNHKFIISSGEDAGGNLWFGAYGGGLYKYDGSNFKHFGKEAGLTGESPISIVCDKNNNLWFGTSKAIGKLDLKKLVFNFYGKKEGFMGIEANSNALCIDSKDAIWFGTIMGLVKYEPSQDLPNIVEPITHLKNFQIHLIDAQMKDRLALSYDQNHITFNFLGVSLTNPEKVKYSYKLQGFDNEWSPETRINTATYSNLPHGDFTMQVKACNDDGLWNKEPSAYTFRITPPYWKTWWFYVISILFVGGGFYLFVKVRTAQLTKEKRVLEEKVRERTVELAAKNEELGEKNAEITASIRYAKRIQEAILPPVKVLQNVFPESFILFLPRDIVSGDFYFIDKREDTLVFAAVDCTGHGVPGAFMSIVGYNILTDSIEKGKLTRPTDILDYLHKGVLSTLRQTAETHEVKDGMDIAMCSFDIKTRKMQFAGAFNSLYHVREKELTEYKADKIAIGAASIDSDLKGRYTHYEVDVQKGDVIYLHSDGYHDQFGGPKGKKFRTKNFKQLLLDSSGKNLADQKEHLHKTLLQWRGEQEQVDDVLVIGVRI